MAGTHEAQNAPLIGANLIEASAGTGKTHTLSSLFLRLLVEKGFAVEQILVVTFTTAATQQLKDRIRQRLRMAKDAFAGKPVDDLFIAQLAKDNAPNGALQIDDAIRRFDEAAIFTIHGFCQRVLSENAFESGASFDARLITETEDFWQEIARDFWRREFYKAPALLVAHACAKGYGPDRFRNLLNYYSRYPNLVVIPQIPRPPLSGVSFFETAKDAVKNAWPNARKDVEKYLMDPALSGTQYGGFKPKSDGSIPREIKVTALLLNMDDYVTEPGFPVFENLRYFTTEIIHKATKKNHDKINFFFFDLCQTFADQAHALENELDQYLAFLDSELFRFAQQTIPERKKKKDIRFFDDLIIALKNALDGPRGHALIKAVGKKYRAALIDEFQDTDSAQYAIFQNLFTGQNQVLFLIGDPKQAIYGFRGADLFSYIRAAKNVDSNYTLGQNWRSSPELIQATNTIFGQNSNPFVLKDIQFSPARVAKENQDKFHCKAENKAPLQIWFLEPEDEKTIKKPEAQDIAILAMTAEISKLLALGRDNKALINNRPLVEKDMAILVRTNNEASAVQKGFSAAGIYSVLYSSGNLFDTDQAIEVRRILSAVADNSGYYLKAALATSLMGMSAAQIDSLAKNGEANERVAAFFAGLHDIWKSSGFMRMFSAFLRREKVRVRLLSYPGGERKLTNVLHLAEVLHHAEKEKNLGISGLRQWLARQMDPSTPRLEEHQLRLESDAKAVQIVTMHKSKGMEYPVVFCPFLWHDSKIKTGAFIFHDLDNNGRITLDLGFEDSKNQGSAQKEILAENIRLAYVAITRAKYRCYMAWGPVNKAETSALSYLFHSQGENAALRFKDLPPKDMREELGYFAQKSRGTICLATPPRQIVQAPLQKAPDNKPMSYARFSQNTDMCWGVASFSSLSSKRRETHKSGADEITPLFFQARQTPPPAKDEPPTIFNFPKGAGPGIMLHELFENMDFTCADSDVLDRSVKDRLEAYGFSLKWVRAISNMVKNVLACPLSEKNSGLILGQVSLFTRANEMEFYFPIKKITPKDFSNVFSGKEFPHPCRDLDFSPIKGYMHGFIDMVFCHKGRYFLVDWKSNHLGVQVQDYGQAALKKAMEEHLYTLQYHLYALALDLYLSEKIADYDYDKHFGGAFYIFLRGVDPGLGPDFGIFADRPDRKTIETMKSRLICRNLTK